MLLNIDSTVSRRKHAYYVGIACAALFTVLWGFAPSYYLRALKHTASPGEAAKTVVSDLVHVHAVAFTAWILLFVTQSVLVATGRTSAHRRLGRAGSALGLLMVLLGVATAIQGARDNWNPGGRFGDSLSFMAVGMFDLLLFSIFAGAGLYYRRRAELHGRLMVLATIGGLMWPAITRMRYVAPRPLLMFGVLGMMVLAAPVRDLWTNRRMHPVSLAGGLVILASFPLRQAVALSDMWRSFAAWLIR